MLQDVLVRLQLPIEHLRSQTYDGAGNMAGKIHGCQAEIKKINKLALYVHCGAHCTNLITNKAITQSIFMRDALDSIQELGKLYEGSGKFKSLYIHQHDSQPHLPVPGRLKPICPTRFLTRSPAIKAAIENYSDILDALEEAASQFGNNTGSRASGLLTCLSNGKTLVGLLASMPIVQGLENNHQWNAKCIKSGQKSIEVTED